MSSPAVVLAAIAARSDTVTVTSAVSVLSVLDPLRLYQDFAQLHLVSGGRAEITAGRIAYAEPFAMFGVPFSEYDDVFEEKLRLLMALRETDLIDWEGRYRPPLRDAPVVPQLDRPLPLRLGVGGSAESAAHAGRLGLRMTLALLAGSPRRAVPLVDIYRSTSAESGHGPDDLGVAAVGHLYVGADSENARDTFYPHYRRYFAEGRGVRLDRATFDEMAGPDGPLVVGSAAEVTAKILRQHELLTLDRFLGQIDLGGLPRHAVLGSIERFASAVAPIIRRETRRWRPRSVPPPPRSSTARTVMHIVALIVSLLLATAMLASGLMKVIRAPRIVALMGAVGVTPAQLPLLGALQIAATIGLIAGIWVPAFAIAAAVGLVLYFAGAIVAHARAHDPGFQVAALFLALSVASLVLQVLDVAAV